MRIVLVAVLAALALPTGAEASSQWFDNQEPIPEGQTVVVPSSGPNVQLALKAPGRMAVKIPCAANGVEAFWNTPIGGQDETRSISFECPDGTRATPILPWSSTLLESEL